MEQADNQTQVAPTLTTTAWNTEPVCPASAAIAEPPEKQQRTDASAHVGAAYAAGGVVPEARPPARPLPGSALEIANLKNEIAAMKLRVATMMEKL